MISSTSSSSSHAFLGTERESRAATAISAKERDAELVRCFKNGDESAFDEIVAHYRAKMLAVALSVIRNHADAEEVAQDTFIRAHRGLVNFRGDSSLATWLHRIAFNLARNRYWYFFRRHRHATQSLDHVFGDEGTRTLADLLADSVPDPAREAANREFFRHVTACMNKLSAHQREILTQRNFQDNSYEEISKKLSISLGTVKSRIARARANLRGLLAEHYPNFEHNNSTYLQWFESSRPTSQSNVACA
jgi:RNA polymerase sigma-70 factor (ECF subfamily)